MNADLERRRLIPLCAARASEGLSREDEAELQSLSVRHPDVDPESFELAAAALDLAFQGRDARAAEGLPAHLRERILASASNRGRVGTATRVPAPPSSTAPAGKLLQFSGWIAAAAAAVLAFVLWSTRARDSAPSVSDLVAQVDRSSDVVRRAWQATQDPDASGATGEVVWSPTLQRGYMRFKGLAVNDPKLSQYQLWIFDGARDDRYPIDGGVFDVASVGGDAVVAIYARLRVLEPKMFAVTVEKPGGVVVSARDRIVVLATM